MFSVFYIVRASHASSVPMQVRGSPVKDDLVSVSKFLCKCMDVMLGAGSDVQSQTSGQPSERVESTERLTDMQHDLSWNLGR